MTDDRELLKTIAFAEGWTIAPRDGRWELCYEPDEWCVRLDSREDAEDYMIRENDHNLDSVDAALSLPWPWDDIADLTISFTGKMAFGLLVMKPNNGVEYASREDNAGRALCECFYQWRKETHREPKPR